MTQNRKCKNRIKNIYKNYKRDVLKYRETPECDSSQSDFSFFVGACCSPFAVMADYKEAPLATRPKTLDPAEYYNLSPEYRRAEEARLALRSRLKRQYLLQLNNPHRQELIVRRTPEQFKNISIE